MDKSSLHKNLRRQITRIFSDEKIENDLELQSFILVVNQTYENYERDSIIFEQAALSNDKEYTELNEKLIRELDERVLFQSKIIDAIKQLSDDAEEINENENFNKLIEILNNEIEQKKRIQEELKKAIEIAENTTEAKSEFLSIMSHEIRTPLNAIIGLIYIMERENTLQSFQENIEVLKNSSQNLFLLINDILDFNKIEAGKIDLELIPFNFSDLVTQISKAMQARASENLTTIKVDIDENFTPHLISDPLRLNQIITNLVSNAVKFTKNGTVTIKLTQLSQDKNYSNLKVEIIDTGIGIEKDKFGLIFQKFSQAETKTSRQFGGTGLGLVITKKLLNLLGTDIQFDSEFGVGSNFYFTLNLPINHFKQEQKTESLQENYKEENLDGMRVLLVEDNLINIKIAQKIMSQWNVEVDLAENGLIATEKYDLNPDKYDVILMDLSMPVMDGYEATTNIREKNKLIPIIALTASASYGYLDRAMQIGINEYVIKPFNPKELNMKLRKYYNI